MSPFRILILTALTMVAFAGNSILCRLALSDTGIDAASFTSIRLISGAVVLWLIVCSINKKNRQTQVSVQGDWLSSFTLFTYAAGFSFAYISLPTATGALLLFGSVQATMICYGLIKGERLAPLQCIGLMVALGGLVGLLLPGVAAPPLKGAVLMMISGMAWGAYSIRGKSANHPIHVTAGNFIRATLFTGLLSLLLLPNIHIDSRGVWYSIASGALASGMGYSLWYSVLPRLKSTNAATIQLSVPVIAALGGVSLLGESITLRLIFTSLAILGGITLVLTSKKKA